MQEAKPLPWILQYVCSPFRSNSSLEQIASENGVTVDKVIEWIAQASNFTPDQVKAIIQKKCIEGLSLEFISVEGGFELEKLKLFLTGSQLTVWNKIDILALTIDGQTTEQIRRVVGLSEEVIIEFLRSCSSTIDISVLERILFAMLSMKFKDGFSLKDINNALETSLDVLKACIAKRTGLSILQLDNIFDLVSKREGLEKIGKLLQIDVELLLQFLPDIGISREVKRSLVDMQSQGYLISELANVSGLSEATVIGCLLNGGSQTLSHQSSAPTSTPPSRKPEFLYSSRIGTFYQSSRILSFPFKISISEIKCRFHTMRRTCQYNLFHGRRKLQLQIKKGKSDRC